MCLSTVILFLFPFIYENRAYSYVSKDSIFSGFWHTWVMTDVFMCNPSLTSNTCKARGKLLEQGELLPASN